MLVDPGVAEGWILGTGDGGHAAEQKDATAVGVVDEGVAVAWFRAPSAVHP